MKIQSNNTAKPAVISVCNKLCNICKGNWRNLLNQHAPHAKPEDYVCAYKKRDSEEMITREPLSLN